MRRRIHACHRRRRIHAVLAYRMAKCGHGWRRAMLNHRELLPLRKTQLLPQEKGAARERREKRKRE
jgi:hypothetical protein